MWDYDSFIGKSQLYFGRAASHPHANDEEVALWLLLGLEFLLRAPLARIHPTLLADPTGDSIMSAAGYPTKNPKSVQASTVITRLGMVIPEFAEHDGDARFLIGLRNEELHTSSSPLTIDQSNWLPHFTRVVDAVCSHLGLEAKDLVGPEIIAHGRNLIGAEDKKLANEIKSRIARCKDFISKLKAEEVGARQEKAEVEPVTRDMIEDTFRILNEGGSFSFERVMCPACESDVVLLLEAVRTTKEWIEGDEVKKERVLIARALSCPICELRLTSTAEVRSAGIEQQYVRLESEDLSERYMDSSEGEYGND